MSQLDVPAGTGSHGDAHPIAREVHRQVREAIDRSEMSLRWIAEGDDRSSMAGVIDAHGRLIRELGQQMVAVAYQLDNLMTLVHSIQNEETGR